ncbi:MAG: NAD(P)H-hydrate dehydratase [Bacteroidales bacterium]|nr:NAD(P)H-hydrate dehydratase [Bacteroidales bacterium]
MRKADTTKHDYGHALLIAGAYGRCGCAILSAKAALRSGCGLMSVHLPSRCVDPMQTAFPEAMVSIDPDDRIFTTPPPHLDRYTALAIGPGIGTDIATQEALRRTLLTWPTDSPLILDADALNILAQRPDILDAASHRSLPTVLTPHAGEYLRLFGEAHAEDIAQQHGVIIVQKAHRTRICSPEGIVVENNTGNAGMATAGSGDVLTGILLGITAQKTNNLYSSVHLSVQIHGKIGDFCTESQSQSSLIASDMVEKLKQIEI